jgi:hypothetical protein
MVEAFERRARAIASREMSIPITRAPDMVESHRLKPPLPQPTSTSRAFCKTRNGRPA